jgi:hypothetical protein
MLSRFRPRSQQEGDHDGLAELRLSRTVNAMLGNVMALETRLICSGVRFPLGSSLLLAARKR